MEHATTDDQFESWLAHMDDALAEFSAALPAALREQLDGSTTSLDALEAWLLSRYAAVADARAAAEVHTVGGAARYLGEVFRQATGSRWAIITADPKYVYRGLPVLQGGKLGNMPVCPLTMVTASLDRRSGHYLSGIVKNFSA